MKTKRISGNIFNPWVNKEEAVELLKKIDGAVRKNCYHRGSVSFGDPDEISIDVCEFYDNPSSHITLVRGDGVITIPKRGELEGFMIQSSNIHDLYKGRDDKSSRDIKILDGYITKLKNEIQPGDILKDIENIQGISLRFHYTSPDFKKEYYRYNEYGMTSTAYDFAFSPELDLFVYHNGADYKKKDLVAIYATANIKPNKISMHRQLSGSIFRSNKLKHDKIHRKHAERMEEIILDYIAKEIKK